MGFTTDRFEITVDTAFFCGICKNVLQKPKFINIEECEHMFCGDCLNTKLNNLEESEQLTCPIDGTSITKQDITKPYRFFETLYCSLKIRCSFYDKCNTLTLINDIETHEIDCEHNPANFSFCTNLCRIELKKNQIDSHNCGDTFKEWIKALSDRITVLEKEIVVLKKDNPDSQRNSTPKQNGSVKVNESKPSSGQKISADGKDGERLFNTYKAIVDKFKNFKFPLMVPQNEWVFSLLEHLTSSNKIKNIIRTSSIEKVIENGLLLRLITRKIEKSNLIILLSLAALEFLESKLTKEQAVMLLSHNDCTLPLLYVPFVKSVVHMAGATYCSNGIGRNYKTVLSHISEQFRFNPFNYNSMLANYSHRKKVDILIIFESLNDQQLSELQTILTPDGYFLILDPESSFSKIRKVSPNGSIKDFTEILVDKSKVTSVSA